MMTEAICSEPETITGQPIRGTAKNIKVKDFTEL
jgi:hypothetical protein